MKPIKVDPFAVLDVDSNANETELQAAYQKAEERHARQAAPPWIRQAVRDAYRVLTEPTAKQPAMNKRNSRIGGAELLLQNETTYFILVSMLDFFLTYMLLQLGAIETNPIADYLFKQFDFAGMLAFKLVIVAIICIVTQVIARRRMDYGRFVIWIGIIVTGAVVIYSMRLLAGQLS